MVRSTKDLPENPFFIVDAFRRQMARQTDCDRVGFGLQPCLPKERLIRTQRHPLLLRLQGPQ